MSRIGKIPVEIPKDVKVEIKSDSVHVEGPKGTLSLNVPSGIKVQQKDNQLVVNRDSDIKQNKTNHGTIRALLRNMIIGVTRQHKKDLEIQGIGFRAQLEGKKVVLNLGFSHQIDFPIPPDVKVAVPTPTTISIEGPDKMLVGQVAAKIRSLKPVEPYKGKGIRYAGEFVRRKQGKKITK